MKKLMPLAAGIVVSSLVVAAGCTTAQIQQAGQNVAALNNAAAGALKTVATSIVASCPAGQAFANAAAAATANPGVAIAADANGLFCAVNKAIVTTATAASAPAAASTPLAGAPLK